MVIFGRILEQNIGSVYFANNGKIVLMSISPAVDRPWVVRIHMNGNSKINTAKIKV